jgi:hypothetical protein
MKKILGILTALFMAVCMTSCLEHDLEELEVYSDCDITGRDIYWRWVTDEVHPGTGAQKVKQVRLPYWSGASVIDKENATAHIRYTVAQSGLDATQKAAFTATKAVMVVTVSTAATIKPIDGAPELGVPGDWTKPNKYEVTAADGTKKVWTITAECGD